MAETPFLKEPGDGDLDGTRGTRNQILPVAQAAAISERPMPVEKAP